MYGLLWYDNIWLRYNYLKIWNLRVQKNLNIEKIIFKVVQMKFLAMHITNQKLSFNVGNLQNILMEHDLNILMIFGIKEKMIILTHTMYCCLFCYLWLLLCSRDTYVSVQVWWYWTVLNDGSTMIRSTPNIYMTRMTLCVDVQGMSAALRDFSQREEHSQSDSCFVLFMSHGYAKGICGVSNIVNSDGVEDIFSTDEIYDCLNTENCPGLRDKPKIILIQSCRGGKLQTNRKWPEAIFIFRLFSANY